MATYTVDTMPSKLSVGDVINCDYSGAAKSCTLPKGTYKLECWGAKGGDGKGNGTTLNGAPGGYSIGNIKITNEITLNIYVGGMGSTVTSSSIAGGGWNGGGNSTGQSSNYAGGGGGGASDVRINSTSLYARVIVAGGGGGMSDGSGSVTHNTSGCGGGISGGSGTASPTQSSGTGGTQTSGGTSIGWSGQSLTVTNGSFGYGGAATNNGSASSGSGGGGWYGGGASGWSGGGGGSGYVYTSSTASNYPSGCLLNSTYYLTDAQTIAGNTSFPSTSGGTETGHSGNGYVRITVISVDSAVNFRSKINSTWIDSDGVYVKIDGSWREAEFAYMRINGSWSETT